MAWLLGLLLLLAAQAASAGCEGEEAEGFARGLAFARHCLEQEEEPAIECLTAEAEAARRLARLGTHALRACDGAIPDPPHRALRSTVECVDRHLQGQSASE